MSNFDFLYRKDCFRSIAEASIEAEQSMSSTYVSSVIMCRRALEIAVKWLYANDQDLELPYQDNLSSLVYEITFRNIVDEKVFNDICYIIKIGNFSVHSNKKVSREEAIVDLKCLFNFMKWLSYCYDENYEEVYFDENKIPVQNAETISREEREKLEQELNNKDKQLQDSIRLNEELRQQLTQEKNKKKERVYSQYDDISEFETRKRFIDIDLEIAGWEFDKNAIRELPVRDMTSQHTNGFVDYVLYGKDGKPVAVVEAKRTSKDPKVGQQQAKLYADCLEKETSQRPIIYFTNGKEIFMWDDTEYPARKVSGYYTQAELQTIINRRTRKNNLDNIKIDPEITGRVYQIEAIKRTCEAFNKKHRKALLVMATGTGKTRTAISIVDVLARNNWIKNVLFLADRTELVDQAKNNFAKLLPNQSCCNLIRSNERENVESSRIIFSTYQTMINCIDTLKNKENNRLFSPGHFDLIIIDEAHRSIYKKYQAIFEYFDGLMVGLTATPRSDIDKNTYSFFEVENNVPTFYYEYDEAVRNGFLVDYHVLKTETKFLREGIKYNDLSQEEKDEFEDTFAEDPYIIDEVHGDEMNKWVFNIDTIKKVIENLMKYGLKVEGGDKLGKTIIFAKNHDHAMKIEETFNKLYPNLNGGKFAQVIDNKINYAHTLIETFEKKDDMPQIAISVDMLDTGIDVPEILNLVFFKPVKSKIKFLQMIGRGTRLCKDIFGPGIDKKEFYIFDCCGNFEYFDENQKGIEAGEAISLTEKIYRLKLDLITELENIFYASEEYKVYRQELINDFHKQISNLNRDSFIVRNKIVYIDKFENLNQWEHIDTIKSEELKTHVIPLFISEDNDEMAKRFDNIVYNIQVKKLVGENFRIHTNLAVELIRELTKLGAIPQVAEKAELIKKTMNFEFWEKANFFEIEKVREELRDLIKLIDKKVRKIYETDFRDDAIIEPGKDIDIVPIIDATDYKKKVENYISGNMDNLIIYKIKHNQHLSETEKKDLERIMFEELGNNEEFAEAYGDEKSVVEVVRTLVGLDDSTADEIFSKYINDNRLNSNQIQFVKMLKDYAVANGIIRLEDLAKDPFDQYGAIVDLFEENLNIFIEIKNDIYEINNNAEYTA